MFRAIEGNLVDVLESKESFENGFRLFPRITRYRDYSFECKGVKLSARVMVVGGYLPIYGQTLSQWMRKKNIEGLTHSVISRALSETKKQARKQVRDGKTVYSSEEYLFFGDENSVEYEAFLLETNGKGSYPKKFKFVKNLLDEPGVELSEYGSAYLYRHTGAAINWDEVYEEEREAEEVLGENVAYRLYEIFPDKAEGRKLETFDDALEYAEYLKEEFLFSAEDCTDIIRGRRASHLLWDSLSYEEIKEMITSYIEDEDELESIDFELIKKQKEEENVQ